MLNTKTKDTCSISLQFEDGSIGSVHYFSNGSSKIPKERLDIYSRGSVLTLDNFRKMRGYDWPGFRRQNLFNQDKGHDQCVIRFLEGVDKNISPICLDELFEVSAACIEVSN